ncbi:hypothetical protein D3C86_1921260 [compost metagenome]
MHFQLHRNPFLHRLDVADHADHLAAGIQAVEGVQGDFQGFAIEGAEAFVEEQRVDAGLVADQIGQRQRQRKAHQEAFTAGQGSSVAQCVRLPGVHHL